MKKKTFADFQKDLMCTQEHQRHYQKHYMQAEAHNHFYKPLNFAEHCFEFHIQKVRMPNFLEFDI